MCIKTSFICRLWLLTLISLNFTYASPPGPQPKIFSLTHGRSYTDIPFRLLDDLIIIPVRINGGKSLNFILDSGTSSPILFPRRTVRKMNLPMGRKLKFQGAGKGEFVEATVIPGIRLQIGDACAPRLGAVALDRHAMTPAKIKGITIHGIIGGSLFNSFAVEIDYPGRNIRLHEGDGFLREQTYTSHPLLVDADRPVVLTQVLWEDSLHTLKLMIDTGFNHSLLLYDNPLIQAHHAREQKIGVGFSGSIVGKVSSVPKLHLGARILFDVHTYFPSTLAYKANQSTQSHRDGIIGNALLKRFCVVLDYANATFYIREYLPWDVPQEAVHPQSCDAPMGW